MSTPLRVGMAAVIGLLLLGGAFYLLGGGGGPNVGAPASPTPSPMPLPTSGELEPETLVQLEAGTYAMSDVDPPIRTLVSFTFTVPAGWSVRPSDGQISKHADEAGYVSLTPWVVTHVYTDACKSEGSLAEVGPSVDDLVTALSNQAGSDVTEAVDLEVGGYPAKLITVSVPTAEHLDYAACSNPGLLIQIWADATESTFFAIPVEPAGLQGGVYIVDVDGDRVVLVTESQPDASAEDIDERDAIIESIRFEP